MAMATLRLLLLPEHQDYRHPARMAIEDCLDIWVEDV